MKVEICMAAVLGAVHRGLNGIECHPLDIGGTRGRTPGQPRREGGSW
jgi:hypothetical protein